MAQDSKIEWTHHTANLWHGCTKVHEGCDHCYTETLSHRWGRDIWGNDKPRLEIKSVWNDLKNYQRLAKAAGEQHRVFVGSMMDIFEKPMPLINSKGEPAIDANDGSPISNEHLRDRLFDEVVPASPNLLFLLLTKRPSNINKYIPESWKTNPPKNVMFGTSPVNQETADKLIPQLLQVNGRRFLSCEPLIGPMDISPWLTSIDWVICGGESGHGARPMNPDWVRSLRDQCDMAGKPFFFKQWGNWAYSGGNSRKSNIGVWEGEKRHTVGMDAGDKDGVYVMTEVGKKAAGRELDGMIHGAFPK